MGGPFMNMRAEWGVNRMLDRLDATPEQKQKVTAIVKSALADLEPMRGSAASIRQDAARLLKADTIDRAEIEKLEDAAHRAGGRGLQAVHAGLRRRC